MEMLDFGDSLDANGIKIKDFNPVFSDSIHKKLPIGSFDLPDGKIGQLQGIDVGTVITKSLTIILLNDAKITVTLENMNYISKIPIKGIELLNPAVLRYVMFVPY